MMIEKRACAGSTILKICLLLVVVLCCWCGCGCGCGWMMRMIENGAVLGLQCREYVCCWWCWCWVLGVLLCWCLTSTPSFEMFESYKTTNVWDTMDQSVNTQFHLVRGGNSTRWTPEIVEVFFNKVTPLFSSLLIHQNLQKLKQAHGKPKDFVVFYDHVLENAGHWLHVDNPKGLLKLFQEEISPYF